MERVETGMLVGCYCVKVDIMCARKVVLWWGDSGCEGTEGAVVIWVWRWKGGVCLGRIGAGWKEDELCVIMLRGVRSDVRLLGHDIGGVPNDGTQGESVL